MLQFATDWSWVTKTFIAMVFIAPLTILIVFMKYKFEVSGESFLLAWFTGVGVAFVLFVAASSTMSPRELIQPFMPFLFVVVLGIVFGGVANVFLAQSILAAPNPGLPWAIFSINTPISYLLAYVCARVFANHFPPMEFNWINLGGIIIIVAGLVMVMYRPE